MTFSADPEEVGEPGGDEVDWRGGHVCPVHGPGDSPHDIEAEMLVVLEVKKASWMNIAWVFADGKDRTAV